VQSQQLPTGSQVFKDEVLARTAALTIQPRKCQSEAIGKNLIETIRIQLSAKSFILSCTTFWRDTPTRFRMRQHR
jgi:hypothetical protein